MQPGQQAGDIGHDAEIEHGICAARTGVPGISLRIIGAVIVDMMT